MAFALLQSEFHAQKWQAKARPAMAASLESFLCKAEGDEKNIIPRTHTSPGASPKTALTAAKQLLPKLFAKRLPRIPQMRQIKHASTLVASDPLDILYWRQSCCQWWQAMCKTNQNCCRACSHHGLCNAASLPSASALNLLRPAGRDQVGELVPRVNPFWVLQTPHHADCGAFVWQAGLGHVELVNRADPYIVWQLSLEPSLPARFFA